MWVESRPRAYSVPWFGSFFSSLVSYPVLYSQITSVLLIVEDAKFVDGFIAASTPALFDEAIVPAKALCKRLAKLSARYGP